MKAVLISAIEEVLAPLGLSGSAFVLEHPDELSHGDYSTNAALVAAKQAGKNPRELAEALVDALLKKNLSGVERIEVAGPGFINFHLSKKFFAESLEEINQKGEEFGKGEHAKGYKVMIEHTDPNPFKEFHIGHLMPNVIGSTIARVFAWNGAEVKQANYQGDKGLHVAKAVWAVLQGKAETLPLGRVYVIGNEAYENDPRAKEAITEINTKIYDSSDEKINKVYEEGREASLKYFESIYKRLNTSFDYYFFESETAPIGKKIVEENLGKVFELSDGAIVFKAEEYDPSLHTRVFVNSQGVPTYEAKDLGNAKNKYDHYPYDLSVVVTGNEIKDYFRVVLAAMKEVLPDLAKKTKHLPHGMLRLPTGKMSSRTGNIITAEELIEQVKEKVKGEEEVAVGAIKYMILRQAIGSDIVFDLEKSVSTEGDSGVYLQYAHARARSILEKAKAKPDASGKRSTTHDIEKLLYRFPEVVERAGAEYAPSHITTYLTALAASFNNFYAHEEVLGDSPESSYRLAVVLAFATVMKNGLAILGIPAPERM